MSTVKALGDQWERELLDNLHQKRNGHARQAERCNARGEYQAQILRIVAMYDLMIAALAKPTEPQIDGYPLWSGLPPAVLGVMPKDQPQNTGVGLYCAPGPAIKQERLWLLRYEDADVRDVIIDREQEAREAFASAEGHGWNCHLFEHALRDPSPVYQHGLPPPVMSDADKDAFRRSVIYGVAIMPDAIVGANISMPITQPLIAEAARDDVAGDAPSQSDIAQKLRALSATMSDIAVEMDYFGGFAEWTQHSNELLGASAVVGNWALEIDAKIKKDAPSPP